MTAIVEPSVVPQLPAQCCAVSVSPLLRELLVRAATLPTRYELDGADARLFAVLVDEMASAREEKHRLPMPTDPRLRKIVEAMAANPPEGATISEWAKRSGVGERTLNRILVQETGLTFGAGASSSTSFSRCNGSRAARRYNPSGPTSATRAQAASSRCSNAPSAPHRRGI